MSKTFISQYTSISAAVFTFFIMSIHTSYSQVTPANNPFLEKYTTPHQVPPFDKIKTEHFIPAFEAGMKAQKQLIEAIKNKRSAPSFQTIIVPYEQSGEQLRKVSSVFYNLTSANTNDALEKINREMAPLMSQHSDDIHLDGILFQRIKAVHDNPGTLTAEQKRLLEVVYKSFVRSGANLDAQKQQQLRDINKQLSSLTVSFGQNLLSENNKFELIIDNEADLAGLPASIKVAAANSAKDAGKPGKWRITLHNPSSMPFLQYADHRALREIVYKGYINRGNNNNELDNKNIVAQLAMLRADRARLLGYDNHAAFVLEESMAKTPAQANALLEQLWKAALPVAKAESEEMQKMMDASGKGEKLQAWDWSYYADKVRKAKYNYDAELLRPYFKLENVRDGIFTLTTKLYGITYKELKNVPRYHEDVSVYEVFEGNGKSVGLIYMDFFPRSSKRGGAWMTSYRKQQEGVKPVISIVCNFSKPTGDQPALLTPEEVETFFHEFGHALHGLLSNVKYNTLSGTSVSRDFVELPSQIMEHWAFEPEMLKLYARHYKTGELIPADLVTKMEKASRFNQGFATTEYLAASLLDMQYHTISSGDKIDPLQFEQNVMDSIGLIPQITPRYRSTYFQHIFSGGYSAGYYSYIWSEVLDSDAFAAFKEAGNIFDPKTAHSFRKNILEKGNTADPMELYKSFRTREPEVKFLLKNRGLD